MDSSACWYDGRWGTLFKLYFVDADDEPEGFWKILFLDCCILIATEATEDKD